MNSTRSVSAQECPRQRFKTGDGQPMPLEFVRIDPFVIPKRALTNSQTELVDTRVLQIIYKVRDANAGLFIGQQLDVYIDTGAERTTLQR